MSNQQRAPVYSLNARGKMFTDDSYYEKPVSYSNSEEVRRNLSYTRRVNTSVGSSSRDSSEDDRKQRRNKQQKEKPSSIFCCLLCLPFKCIYQGLRATAKLACYSFIAGIALVLIFQILVYFSLFSTASNKYFGGETNSENTPHTLFDRTAHVIGTALGATYFSAESGYAAAKWTMNTASYWLGIMLDFIEYWRGNRPSLFTKYNEQSRGTQENYHDHRY